MNARIDASEIRVLCVTLYGDRAEAATLIGLHRAGCKVRVCCMPDSPYIPQFEAAGIPVTRVTISKRIDKRAIKILRRELSTENYNIVHLLHNKPVSNGLRALRAFPRPKVIVYRGIVGNVHLLNPVSWMRYLNPRIDRVICVAEAVRQYFLGLRFLGYRLPRDKFVSIHKGHDPAWYRTEPADIRRFGVPESAFVVGSVANLRPRKGIEVLVDAFGLLPRDLPIYLLLVGHMDGRRLDRAIARNPNRDRIRKAGFQRAAPAIIASCQVSVLPTLRREGLPKTVIEAMVNGVPPIVTDTGGSPELVENGKSGLVVPPGDQKALADAILELYRDPELRLRLGRAAQQRIRDDFNIEDTVTETLALYRSLLANQSGQTA